MKKTMPILILALGLFSSCGSVSPGNDPDTVGTLGLQQGSTNTFYVSVYGNDTNAGTIAYPLRSFQAALDKASGDGPVRILATKGDYSAANGGLPNPTNGFTFARNNVTIIGGYNFAFTARAGNSILIGNGYGSGEGFHHVALIEYSSNVYLEGLHLTGNFWNGNQGMHGGGLSINSCSNVTVNCCKVSSNTTYGSGGGVAILNSVNLTVIADIFENRTGFSAVSSGGLLVQNSSRIVISGKIYNNSAVTTGGGASLVNVEYVTMKAIVSNNFLYNESSVGGGVYAQGNNLTIGGTICNNNNETAFVYSGHRNDGGGLYLKGNNNKVNSTVTGNLAGRYGGGIYVEGNDNLIHAVVTGNTAKTNGDGIALGNGNGNQINGCDLTLNGSVRNHSVLFLWNTSGITGLKIAHTLFGGIPGSQVTAILEAGSLDTTGHTLYNNRFDTNSLAMLYRDFINGETNSVKAVNQAGYSGAALAAKNQVTNL